MKNYSFRYGILYIVSEIDCEYQWENTYDNKSIMNVYIGDIAPSKRHTSRIEC